MRTTPATVLLGTAGVQAPEFAGTLDSHSIVEAESPSGTALKSWDEAFSCDRRCRARERRAFPYCPRRRGIARLLAGVGTSNRLQVEGDSLVGVHEQQAMTGRSVVDAAQHGRNCVPRHRADGNCAARPKMVATFRFDRSPKAIKRVAGRIDLHRAAGAVGNEHAVDKRQSLDAMVLAVADQDLGRRSAASTVAASGRIDAAIAPAGEAVAAGHHVDQVERLDRSLGNLADEIGRLGGCGKHDRRLAVTLLSTRADSFSCKTWRASLPFPSADRRLHFDRAAEDVRRRVCPASFTSTPNSVPRSVTVAVGVRTAK